MTDGSPGTEAHKAGEICFRGVSKQYPGREGAAVKDLSFEVPAGEICVLIGPSGCGKTTALKLVNRLIPMTEGDITIDGRSVNDHEVTELRRGIGYVFQEIGLFPHMTIEENIGSVPRLLGWKKERIRGRASELLELVGLDPKGDLKRYPGEFSGGQQQRIGVARAMAVDPPIMLMDEPFGAIDPITRDRLQNDFLRLQSEIKKTIVFVTHDIDEAIKMGDRIAIMREGQLVQLDTSDKLLASPSDDFVASFVGADRGLKRLRLWTLRDLDLEPGSGGSGPSVPIDSSLRDALSLMLTDGSRELEVTGDDGSIAGRVKLDQIIGYVGPEGEATAQDEVARA
ncbi:MAG TPA: ABC transporter ATP-binding protein [Thermoleophilaceae bacterium]